jgi:hypothetical protein
VESRKQIPIRPPWDDLPGEYTNLSLTLPTVMSIDDWLELCKRLERLSVSSRFWLGDALLQGEDLFDEEHYQVYDELEAQEGTLKNYAWVAEQVPPPIRKDDVEWAEYKEIAAIKDSDLQMSLIDRISGGERLGKKKIQEIRSESEEGRTERRQMATCPCCHGSGKVARERLGNLKAILQEHNVPEEFPG